MADTGIENQSTERLERSFKVLRWLLPLLIFVTLISVMTIIYSFIEGRDYWNSSLWASTAFCLILTVYFYAQKKKLSSELHKRND